MQRIRRLLRRRLCIEFVPGFVPCAVDIDSCHGCRRIALSDQ